MNRGTFAAQVNTGWDILQALNLAYERVWYPKYPEAPAAEFRPLSYVEVWTKCFSNQYYDFMLSDRSLIQFRVESFRPLKASYVYYECPFKGLSYAEFIEDELELSVEEAGDLFREEFDDYLLTCGLKETVTPIRYDYDPEQYLEGLHPASHIHFGYGNGIRVGTKNVLRPLSFVLFIMRQCYSQSWKLTHTMSEASTWCNNVRDGLEKVDEKFANALDIREMMLI
jgi:hypothetical protein